MSNRAINAVLDHSKTKGSQRLLMFVIADGIGKDSGFYHAKVETLRRECNCSERYIQTLIGKLLKTPELIAFETQGHATKFAIPILEGEPGYAPEECHSESHTCAGFHTPLDITREDVRNADRTRRGARSGGASQITPRGEQQYTLGSASQITPHAEQRKGVNRRSPRGEQEITPRVNRRSPGGEQEITQYPSVSHFLNPTDIPGASSSHDEHTGGTPEAPALPACEPITTISRAMGGTPPPLVAPPPSPTDRMVWRLVCTEMEAVMSPVQRREWLDRLELLSAGPDDYAVLAPTPYAAQFVETRWGGHFRAALRHATGHHEVQLEFLSLGVPA